LTASQPFTVVLGVAQDAGHPQAACTKACCAAAWDGAGHLVSCLGVVDPVSGERWMLDATPDFRSQLRQLDLLQPPRSQPDLAGVMLTHAHMGHYTGLLHLGREAIGADAVPVYAMPQMRTFLSTHGPWELLLRAGHVRLVELEDRVPVALNERLQIVPFVVPHRHEYTETVGYSVRGAHHAVAYLPDIDKWERWSEPVERLLETHDVCYLDGTFFSDGEIPGRNMADIPHPFIEESLTRFASLAPELKSRVRFIHLNHTNPALDPRSEAAQVVRDAGLGLAEEGERVGL